MQQPCVLRRNNVFVPQQVPANAVKTYFKNKLTAVNADPIPGALTVSLRRGWLSG